MTLKTHLAILQQSEYDLFRYKEWVHRHQHDVSIVEPKKKTAKYMLLYLLSSLFSLFLSQEKSIELAISWIAAPEHIAKQCIIVTAQIKLRYFQMRGLTVVAIAGSYGKTSTKHIMQQLLSPFVETLATNESVNTKLGIALTIHRQLHTKHKLFITELGAYTIGDVKELVLYTHPKFGVLTPIGTEHLERFKTMDNVIEAETELISTLPIKVICADTNMLLLPEHKKTSRVSYYGFFPNSYYDVSNITVSRAGTEATLAIGDTSQTIFVPLYGKHNILNILPSFFIAKEIGIAETNVLSQIMNLKPVKHRMDPTLTENNILIIDNGYNTNPDSSKESLLVLSQMQAKHKIIVTPGFVEMGEKQDAYNMDFGKRIAQVFTVCAVLGKTNKHAIIEGLRAAKFPKTKIIEAENEIDAMNKLKSFLVPNSVVLFEGGTPEIYQ